MSSSAQTGILVSYRDPNRYAWWLSLVLPLVIWTGPALYLLTGHRAWFWFPVAFFYACIPLCDHIVGRNTTNPPAEAVAKLESDLYYRIVTWLIVPVLYISWITGVWFASTHHIEWWVAPALVIGVGSIGGFCINVAHEMGHKNERIERLLTKLVLAPSFYGHFTIDHNRGHHREVSTPEDHASARMGESIYRFATRELPGAFLRAWSLEKELLARRGFSVWSWRNEILQTAAITAVLWSAMVVWLGWKALPWILAAALWSDFQLTSANYIEHYGLMRKRLPNGKYEPCEPRHSWNSDFRFSNYALLHLQRHSDHHAWPTRPYQVLRHFDGVPEMPNGYFGMFMLSYCPPLWFRVMDPLLVRAVGGDPERINFDAASRSALLDKYFVER